MTYDEDDLFTMAMEDFCEEYGITPEEYEMLIKQSQEM